MCSSSESSRGTAVVSPRSRFPRTASAWRAGARQHGPDLGCSHGAAPARAQGAQRLVSPRSRFPRTASAWRAGATTTRSGSGMQPRGSSSESSRGTAIDVYSVAFSPNGERVASGSTTTRSGSGMQPRGSSSESSRGTAGLCQLGRVFPERRARGERELGQHGPDLGCSHGAAPARAQGAQRYVSPRSRFPRTASAWRAGATTRRSGSGMQPRGSSSESSRGTAVGVYSVAFSPNGERVASGSDDNTVRIWDAATGQLQRELKGHSDHVYSVAFSPNGERVASGSVDNTVRIWDAHSRFHPIARDASGQLYDLQGRAKRASIRDLVDLAGFDDHMMTTPSSISSFFSTYEPVRNSLVGPATSHGAANAQRTKSLATFDSRVAASTMLRRLVQLCT